MDEHFLHYIWKFQKFNTPELRLTNGQPLRVFDPGYHNQDSGPDFEEARIKIDSIEWAGQIEIHVKSSDWKKHGHTSDTAYNNVVLHVVWDYDQDIEIGKEVIPTLELKSKVDPFLLKKYHIHVKAEEVIACGSQLDDRSSLTISSMLDRVLVERLERKSSVILRQLDETNNDWEEVTFRTIAANFGFSTNKDAFSLLAKHLPFSVLKKNLNDLTKTEALIFGQAGFLKIPQDNYQQKLKNEFEFLFSKYKLEAPLQSHQWKFGRMRPANFPSVRLAQFASLWFHQPKLFSSLKEIEQPKEIIDLLNFDLPTYWQEHYDFGKIRSKSQKKMGQSTLDNILINSVIPLLAAFSKYEDNQAFMNKALEILEKVKPEQNRVTKEWVKIGRSPRSAFESQAMIQLLNEYCKKRKCLQCNIGVDILNR